MDNPLLCVMAKVNLLGENYLSHRRMHAVEVDRSRKPSTSHGEIERPQAQHLSCSLVDSSTGVPASDLRYWISPWI